MAETKNDLLPCPFAACSAGNVSMGGDVDNDSSDTRGWQWVRCNECSAEGPVAWGRIAARSAWNQRHTPPAASGTTPEGLVEMGFPTVNKAASGIAEGITEERMKQYPCCLMDSHISGEEGYSEIRCKRHLNRNGRPESRVTYGPR